MWDCSSDDSREMEIKMYPIEGEPFSQYILQVIYENIMFIYYK